MPQFALCPAHWSYSCLPRYHLLWGWVIYCGIKSAVQIGGSVQNSEIWQCLTSPLIAEQTLKGKSFSNEQLWNFGWKDHEPQADCFRFKLLYSCLQRWSEVRSTISFHSFCPPCHFSYLVYGKVSVNTTDATAFLPEAGRSACYSQRFWS